MIKCKNVSYTYQVNDEFEDHQVGGKLDHINLEIEKGQFVLFCGSSGSGKTTITRILNGLIPHFFEGELSGDITIDDEEYKDMSLFDISSKVGSVFQNPRSQFFNVNTTGEVAFTPENHGWDKDKIIDRINEVCHNLDLSDLMDRNIFALSGGQKQKIACACATAINPMLYVFDEPSSNLDAKGIRELRELLIKLKKSGKTIVIAEHRLYYIYDLLDQVYYLKNGKIAKQYTGNDFRKISENDRYLMGLRPFTLEGLSKIQTKSTTYHNQSIQVNNLSFKYKNSQIKALDIDQLSLNQKKVTAIIGHNGAGKTTFLRCLSGLEKKAKGSLKIDLKNEKSKHRLKNTYIVMQDVNHQLFTQSVIEEVLISMPIENEKKAQKYLEDLDVLEFEHRHPMSLSGGQKQRVAIACAMASNRPMIIFDEPTSGLDLKNMIYVSNCVNKLTKKDKTVIVVSHDLEFILRSCNDVIHLENGKVLDRFSLDNDLGRNKLFSFFKENYNL